MKGTADSMETGATTAPAGRELVQRVFDVLADRFTARSADIATFTETGCSFEEWAVWEGVAALHGHESTPDRGHGHGWTVRPHPPYAEAGVTGSREVADLLVFEPGRGGRVLIELSIIQDWSRNSWIDKLDGDTDKLSRPILPGIVPMQIIVAASRASSIDVDPTWQRWLGMSKVWNRPTDMHRSLALGPVGHLAVQGWVMRPDTHR